MKTCFKCGEEKPLSEFYRHAGMADGHLNKCKACARKDVKANRERKIDYYRAYDAYRYKNDPRVRERLKRNRSTPASKQSMQKSGKKWISSNPEKYTAHNILNAAVRDEKLTKPTSCARCGKEGGRIEGHHADYSKPLEVEWLCRQCHVDLHSEKEAA